MNQPSIFLDIKPLYGRKISVIDRWESDYIHTKSRDTRAPVTPSIPSRRHVGSNIVLQDQYRLENERRGA